MGNGFSWSTNGTILLPPLGKGDGGCEAVTSGQRWGTWWQAVPAALLNFSRPLHKEVGCNMLCPRLLEESSHRHIYLVADSHACNTR